MIRKLDLLTTALLSFSFCFTTATANPVFAQDSDKDAIRAQAEKYEKAFEAKDIESILNLWLADGCYTGPYGRTAEGRDSIRVVYEQFFENASNSTIKLSIDSIKKVGDNIAIEKGTIKNVAAPGRETVYTAIHVKKDDAWKVASVVERLRMADGAKVEDLHWLSGSWKAKGSQGEASIKTGITRNKNFLVSKFEIQTADGDKHSDMQVIGIDPANGGITSWVFDSDGGVGRGYWFKDGSDWVVETVRYGADGVKMTSTQVLSKKSDDSYTWRAVERVLDGVSVPDKSEITIERVK